jgi:DNA-binding NtrC family response regulator
MADLLEGTLPADAAPRARRGALDRQPQLFVLLECDRPLALSTRHSLAGIDTVVLGRGAERGASRDRRTLELRIPDPWMSSTHAAIARRHGSWVLEDAGSRNGTSVDGAPVDRQTLVDGDLIELGHTLFLFRDPLEVEPDDAPDFDTAGVLPPAPGLLTALPSYARQLATLRQIAPSEVGILLLGESGTGKELIARAIAGMSKRKGAFVGVNCGGIPDQLIESEMFGAVKGAYTGATADRTGLIRTADTGTLFLDEIADLPPSSQAALLRVLQEKRVRPVGDTRDLPVDIRIVSATHRDLDGMVRSGAFRTDLFARLAGFRMTLPPLRERREDLGILIGSILLARMADRARSVQIAPEAARALFRYDWPLNIRELENALSTASVLAAGDPIAVHHLPEQIRAFEAPAADRDRPGAERTLSADEEQHRAELAALLEQHRGNVSAVARATGKARQQVHRWMKRYGLDPNRYR